MLSMKTEKYARLSSTSAEKFCPKKSRRIGSEWLTTRMRGSYATFFLIRDLFYPTLLSLLLTPVLLSLTARLFPKRPFRRTTLSE